MKPFSSFFTVDELKEKTKQYTEETNLHSYEFFSSDTMSLLYLHLDVGVKDTQREPHAQDEAYVLLDGEGTIMVDGKNHEVKKGSIVFVAKGIRHLFFDVKKPLEMIVFFAPKYTGYYEGPEIPGAWEPENKE